MSEEKKNINLGFRATGSRQEELKVIAAKRRQSVQEMLEDGLVLLLGQGDASKSRYAALNTKDQGWHDMLAAILGSGDKGCIDAVTKNLETFHRLIELLHTDNPRLRRAR